MRAAGVPYDLVLMDVMPEMDGLEAARRIRVAEALVGDARTYMLALKANAQTDDREAVLSAGLDGLLIKPLDREHLREALSTASARAFDACGLTRVSPHCHNSVVGPWCTGQRQIHR